MKVRMLQGLSGPHYCHTPGDVADFPADEAKRLIEAGIGEAVAATGKAKAETTSKAAPTEKRALFGGKKKG